jgi:hypothetical protein
MLSIQHRSQQKQRHHTKTFASIAFVEAVQTHAARKAVWQSHEFVFMPSPSSQSMAKPAAARQLRYHFIFWRLTERIKMQRKSIAACQRTRLPKDYGIKTQSPTHRSHLFYSVSFWLLLMPLMAGR